jgi:hypothetical protein
MSWTLKVQRNNQQLTKFTILEDDISFYAILKRSHVEHFKINSDTYSTRVRVLHLGNYNELEGQHLIFYMTLLESTTLEHFYPKFMNEGIMGRWKLSTIPDFQNKINNSTNTNQEPLVSLVEIFEDKNVHEFLSYAKSKKNPEFIRNSYLKVS